jgi:hypothetical protein
MHWPKRSNFRERIFKLKIQLLFSRKTRQSNLSWLHKAFSSSTTFRERLSKDRLSLTSESETFLEDLTMRQRPVKSPFLHLGFSSSSELEKSSLEKSQLLRTAHARDKIFWNFFFLLSLKRYFLLLLFLLESFRLVYSYLLEETSFFLWGQSAMKWLVSSHSKQPLGDLLSLRNLCKARNFITSRVISLSGMLSYCSSEGAAKEDRTNSKADETVLVWLASWPATRALVMKVLLVKKHHGSDDLS